MSDISDNFLCILLVETNKKKWTEGNIKLKWRQLNDKYIFEINYIVLHSDWNNLYGMPVDYSNITLISKKMFN